MAHFEKQKAEKLTMQDVVREQLSGNIRDEFEKFLEFLNEEKIKTVWKSINGFNANYKGERICTMTLGAPGWLDNAIKRKNYISINVLTADWDFDKYLEGQNEKIADLFMEQISNKCVHCRPTCGCSKASGRTVQVSGKKYENVCMNALLYKFYVVGDDMREMTMCSPCALYPPVEIHPVPLETIKNLILARKEYAVKSLAAGK